MTDHLTDPGRQESADDAQNRRENEARRIVRARHQEARDDTGDKTDDDDPDNSTHDDPRTDCGYGSNLEHDPEKWIPVFGKDHAHTKRLSHRFASQCHMVQTIFWRRNLRGMTAG